MKSAQQYKHKNTNEVISAIQYVGDKNKFNICEFLKGKKFQVEFAQRDEEFMKITLGNDDYFKLHEKEWLIKKINNSIDFNQYIAKELQKRKNNQQPLIILHKDKKTDQITQLTIKKNMQNKFECVQEILK